MTIMTTTNKVLNLVLIIMMMSSTVIQGASLNGEEVCENRGFTKDECLSRSICCDWDDGQCWSRIGRDICDEYEDGGNYDDAPEKCWAFIGNYEWDFFSQSNNPLEYSSSSYPESRMCEFGDDTWAYSPEAYHDYSCCTTSAAYSLLSDVFYNYWSGNVYSAKCFAYREMMSMILCDPGQGKFIDANNSTLKISLSSCEKFFEACGMPGENYPDSLSYSDPESMCYELWLGPNGGQSSCGYQYYDQSYTTYAKSFLCDTGLNLTVVNDYETDEDCDCAYVLDPSDDLVKYYESRQFGYGDNDYPDSCGGDFWENFDWKTIIGGVVGICLSCCCLCFLIYWFCSKKNNEGMNHHQEIVEEVNEFAITPTDDKINTETIGMEPIPAPEPVPMVPAVLKNEVDSDKAARLEKLENIKHLLSDQEYADKRGEILLGSSPRPTTTNQPAVAAVPTFQSEPEVVESGEPIEENIVEPEPELGFVQKLDLRELDDKKRYGLVSEKEYQQKRHEIIYGK